MVVEAECNSHFSVKKSLLYILKSQYLPLFSSVPRARAFEAVRINRRVPDSDNFKAFLSKIGGLFSKNPFSVSIKNELYCVNHKRSS